MRIAGMGMTAQSSLGGQGSVAEFKAGLVDGFHNE